MLEVEHPALGICCASRGSPFWRPISDAQRLQGSECSPFDCRLKTMAIFSSPDQVNQAIQDAAAMLGVARPALGICCTSRGSVYGVLCFRDGADAPWLDCSDCPRSISGDSRACAKMSFDSDARHSAALTAHSLQSLLTPGRTIWWRDPVLNLWHELTHQTSVRTCCVGGCRNLAQAW